MPDSKQLVVLKRLTALIEGANPDNDDPATDAAYAVDLRGAVFRGRSEIGASDPKPCIVILEAPQPINGIPADTNQTVRKEEWRLLVQGFVQDDKTNPSDPAYALKAIVEQRLSRLSAVSGSTGDPVFPEDYLLGRLVVNVVIGQGVVRPPTKEVSPTAFFYIPLTVELKTDITNPYDLS